MINTFGELAKSLELSTSQVFKKIEYGRSTLHAVEHPDYGNPNMDKKKFYDAMNRLDKLSAAKYEKDVQRAQRSADMREAYIVDLIRKFKTRGSRAT